MLGGAGHSALEGGEVGGDAIIMAVNKGLLAFGAEEEGAFGAGVHEEVSRVLDHCCGARLLSHRNGYNG